MKTSAKAMRSCCVRPATLKRLVQLYEATGKKDDAAKWRKELEARKNPEKNP